MDQNPSPRGSFQVRNRIGAEDGRCGLQHNIAILDTVRNAASVALAGARQSATKRTKPSLAALLHVAPDELFRVLLEDRVDLVQEIVDVLGDLRVPLGYLRVGLDGDVLDLLIARAPAALRLTTCVSG